MSASARIEPTGRGSRSAGDGRSRRGAARSAAARIEHLEARRLLSVVPILSGQSAASVITASNFRDTYTFFAMAGDSVRVTMGEVTDTDFDPKLALYGPDGMVVSDVYSPSGAGVTIDAQGLARSGTYSIVAADERGDETGSYSLTLARLPAVQVVEEDDGPILDGQVRSGTIFAGDLDIFTFSATAGDAVHVTMAEATDTGLDPKLELYDPAGTRVAYSNSAGGASVSIDAAGLSLSGTYSIVASDEGGNETGDCSISLSGSIRPFMPWVTLTGPGAGAQPTAAAFDGAGAAVFSVNAFDAGFGGGVRVASADLTGDGVPELVVGSGAGASHVKVLNGVTGTQIPGPLGSFLVYPGPGDTSQDPNSDYYRLAFQGGIFVAAGDVDGDGEADLITGADAGAGPHVKAFSGATGQEIRSFWAFDPGFAGGVRVAAGDIDGDGRDDIICGSGLGAAHVRVFGGADGQLIAGPLGSFLVHPGPGDTPQAPNSDYYRLAFTGGIYVAAGDANGDGADELVTAAGAGAGPHVKVFAGPTGAALASFWAYDQAFGGGVRIGCADVNGDGRAEVVTGPGPGLGDARLRVFDLTDPNGPPLLAELLAYPGFDGGVFVAGSA